MRAQHGTLSGGEPAASVDTKGSFEGNDNKTLIWLFKAPENTLMTT